ncbi:glycerophosphoryl diester phosphodiesterase [Flexistipes sinusarabici DSM 4947]|uniref:Glycerophosphoryl diester phosphodiesterase n=1 Tax=Flexistipes sinusarabici (strain ATCC 49648 / DSM 4947 / MAS 10) TaxID=717231 RepID=F8E9R9_FLESM|nr:glycerophosphodiester phosphodiesterase family protein [Flexistipes sinusarabici]AEI14252.1 glycerophosphoryl diester phosphodiesterase [Flexistipes sinusarabici DSM 4947]
MKIIAHRGSNLKAPENTVSAIKQAWLDCADGVELDVRLTSDKNVVAFHDENTKRLTGTECEINKYSFNFLRNLDCILQKDSENISDKIPEIEEIIAATEDEKELFLEIKCGKEILKPLREKLADIFPFDKKKLNIISFLPEVLINIWSSFHEIKTYKLIDLDRNPSMNYLSAVNEAVKNGITGLGISGDFYRCRQMVILAKSAGLQTNVWTVDDTETAAKYHKIGLDYLTTNNPGLMRKTVTMGGC